MPELAVNRVELAGFAVSGLRVVAGWTELHGKVPSAWRDVFARVPRDTGFLEVSLGVTDGLYTELVGVRSEDLPSGVTGLETLHVPANRWLHLAHEGPATEIAERFGAIYAYAEARGLEAGELKLDMGYTRAGGVERHDLYVALEPAASPQWTD